MLMIIVESWLGKEEEKEEEEVEESEMADVGWKKGPRREKLRVQGKWDFHFNYPRE